MNRIPCALVAALFLALVLPGCATGLDPTLMELQVKPLANFSTDAANAVPSVEETIMAAVFHANTLLPEDRVGFDASIAKVRALFALPKKPGKPYALDELRTAAKRCMETIRKGGDK
jgi:hypothetical protein